MNESAAADAGLVKTEKHILMHDLEKLTQPEEPPSISLTKIYH